METITLGRQGPAVPPLAVGTLPFGTTLDTPTSHRILDAALDAGATFLDTANNYAFWVDGATGDESESTLGGWFAARRGARDRVTLASKIGARPRPSGRSFADALGLRAAAVRAQVDASLARLRTDRLDVLYAHVDDSSVPLEETVGALQAEVRRGTARIIGCSNLTAPRPGRRWRRRVTARPTRCSSSASRTSRRCRAWTCCRRSCSTTPSGASPTTRTSR